MRPPVTIGVAAARQNLYWWFMTEEVFGKHMVWTEHPTTKLQLGIGYSSFKEAQHESVKLEQAGYKILKITPTTLPIPNIRG